MKRIRYLFERNTVFFIYALGTVAICWTGVWRDIGNGAQWAMTNNCIGFCVFPMVLCRFKIHDFLKPIYFVWLTLFLIFSYPIFLMIRPNTDYNAQYICAVINVGLYGLILIRMIVYMFMEFDQAHKMSVIFWLWIIMFAWAIISINESIYPLWFFVMFGSLFLAPSNKAKMEDMIEGITLGILVFFFWVQGRAFLYRPYDTGAQYYGHFTNPSVNCMFYLVVYSAWLHKLNKVIKENKSKLLIALLYVFTFAMLDFIYLTGSRGGAISATLMTFAYIVVHANIVRKKGISGILVQGIFAVLIFILMFVPVYSCARYIPALRHHPVWYRDYSEKKVHSWDPIDSEKYTTLEEALNNFVKMKNRTINIYKEDPQEDGNDDASVASYNDPSVNVNTEEVHNNPYGVDDFQFKSMLGIEYIKPQKKIIEYPGFVYVLEYEDGTEPGVDQYYHPAGYFSEDNSGLYLGVLGVRKYIYKYFVDRLNFFGHREIYPGVYFGALLGYYGHSHNSYIQVAYCFGTPSGVAFLLMCILGAIIPFFWEKKSLNVDISDYLFTIIFLIAYISYGMIDCLSLLGNIMYSVLFLALLPVIKSHSA